MNIISGTYDKKGEWIIEERIKILVSRGTNRMGNEEKEMNRTTENSTRMELEFLQDINNWNIMGNRIIKRRCSRYKENVVKLERIMETDWKISLASET